MCPMTADQIIDALGGTVAVAEALRLPPTTVSSWRPVNFIPEWRHGPLLSLALEKGVTMATTDFPTPEARKPRKEVAA